MKYYQVIFTIQPHTEIASDVLTSLLADAGFETFVPFEQGVVGYVQQALYDHKAIDAIIHGFLFPDYSITYHLKEVPDEDWNQKWEEEGFAPIVLDNLICVHDTHHTNIPPCKYDIVINPRMAFGTGTHPTTQQILRQLASMNLKGLRIIDAGCGTGVLGMIAAMKGAREIFSYDIDIWSVENTRANAELNGIKNLIVKEGDAKILAEVHDYDMLIANINRNILLADLPYFSSALKPSAQLLLSGFYEEDAIMLIEKGKHWGFKSILQSAEMGWCMLLLQRG